MKTPEDISAELEALVNVHYYSEDFELLSSLKAYRATLHDQEVTYLEQVVLARLINEGSIVDVLLSSVVNIPSSVPVLTEKLNREIAVNQTTRALIQALGKYKTEESYQAVERFIDSDQELEALTALAELDFVRTLPVVFRRVCNAYYYNVLLQIMYDRSKAVGLEVLISNILNFEGYRPSDLHESMISLLYSKKDPYNPFSQDEIHRIILALRDI